MSNEVKLKETEIGLIPADWDYLKLGELCSFQTGKLNSNMAEENGIYPFFTCSPEILNINSYSFDCEAILLAGNNAEGKFNVKYYNGKFDVYQRTYVINIKNLEKLDYSYLYFCLILSLDRLRESSQGTATKFLTMNILNSMEIPVPHIGEQIKIGQILSSLDDQIHLNNQMNQTLEKIGQTIFMYWFVNFEFPNENGQPYKSSGGKMVDSELGEIPVDWDVVRTSETIEINPKLKVDPGSEKVHVPMTGLSKTSMVITEFGKRKGNSGAKFQNYDTLFARITPSTEHGKTAFVQFLKSDEEIAIGSTEFIVMRSRTLNPYYVYCLARYENFRKHAINSMTGTSGRQRVQNECFDDYYIAQPDQETLSKFADLMEPIFNKIHVQNDENQNLAQIRDSLLPKLMSGRIRV